MAKKKKTPKKKTNKPKPKLNLNLANNRLRNNNNSFTHIKDLDLQEAHYYNKIQPDFKQFTGTNPETKYLPSTAYKTGGVYDPSNRCAFKYKNNNGETKSIYLLTPPTGISWTYQLRTNVIDTYAGQVVQVLGVQIDNFKLTGYIPNGVWGKTIDQFGNISENYQVNDSSYYPDVIKDPPALNTAQTDQIVRNGLVQLGNFFKDFFSYKTQIGGFGVENMWFEYPHYGWTGGNALTIIPYEFPRIRFANDEILPQWELNCSLVEYMSSHFIGMVTDAAKTQLKELKSGIGFAEFIKWSDYLANGVVDVSDIASSLGASLRNFILNFDASETDALNLEGFSYPDEIAVGENAKPITKAKINKIIQDRFTRNVS